MGLLTCIIVKVVLSTYLVIKSSSYNNSNPKNSNLFCRKRWNATSCTATRKMKSVGRETREIYEEEVIGISRLFGNH